MENKNNKEKEIIDNIDRAINELVYEKTQIIKAYNYYHGKEILNNLDILKKIMD